MKRFKVSLIAALVLWTASALWADPSPETVVRDSIFVNIGATTPLNPTGFNTTQTPGYNGGLGYGFGLSPLFQLVIDANSDNFPLNSAAFNGASGGNLRIGTLLANIRLRVLAQDNPVVPYLIAGLGAARVEQEAITNGGTLISPASSTANFAGRFGIGVDIKLTAMAALYIESSGYGILTGNSGNTTYNSFRLGGKFNL
jgi:hypothetical protein